MKSRILSQILVETDPTNGFLCPERAIHSSPGHRPGNLDQVYLSPERAIHIISYVAPLQGFILFCTEPRAVPWAGMSNPFRVENLWGIGRLRPLCGLTLGIMSLFQSFSFEKDNGNSYTHLDAFALKNQASLLDAEPCLMSTVVWNPRLPSKIAMRLAISINSTKTRYFLHNEWIHLTTRLFK